jgi:hypothetical protein
MEDLEAWRERLRQAQAKYTQASVCCCEIQAGKRDAPLEQALREKEEARAEFIRVLEIVTGLLKGR